MAKDDCCHSSSCIHIQDRTKGVNSIQNKIWVVVLRKKATAGIRWQLVVSAIDLASDCLEC